MNTNLLREILTDAIRYWEVRRFIYNGVLAFIVLGYFVAGWPGSKSVLVFDNVLGVFLLAVLANIAYCAAYPVDIFIQLSGFRDIWPRLRWMVLILGILFASVITHFMVKDTFH
jgi:hypothetical protein